MSEAYSVDAEERRSDLHVQASSTRGLSKKNPTRKQSSENSEGLVRMPQRRENMNKKKLIQRLAQAKKNIKKKKYTRKDLEKEGGRT